MIIAYNEQVEFMRKIKVSKMELNRTI